MVKQTYLNKCTVCGKEFETTRKWTKTCSEECRKKHCDEYKAKYRATHPHKRKPSTKGYRLCPVCDHGFTGYRNQKYCSDTCSSYACIVRRIFKMEIEDVRDIIKAHNQTYGLF